MQVIIALTAVLSFLLLGFNALLSAKITPVKENQDRMEAELKENQGRMEAELKKNQGRMEAELKEVKDKLDQLLEKS